MVKTLLHKVLIIPFAWITLTQSFGQTDSSASLHLHVQPEWMMGKVVPNYKRAPETYFRRSLFLNFSLQSINSSPSWATYYQYPFTGVSLSYSKLGNDTIYGDEFSIIPYLMFTPFRRWNNNLYLKAGLGMAYFSHPFEPELNPGNKSIGSHYNWAFQLFMYQLIPISRRTDIVIGGGYLHASNGHTQLPNLGLNSAMLSVSANVDLYSTQLPQNNTKNNFNKRISFIQVRQGFGMHELGGSTGPIGGTKRNVYATSLAYGIIFKEHLKIRTGFTYRYYQHFYHLIQSSSDNQYTTHPIKNSSGVFFFLGSEFLIGHFSIDIEGGLNLYKPFYKEFYRRYEGSTKTFKFFLKSTFPCRLGIQYYLINTDRNPKTNVFLGGHINANFGQADFSSFNVGLVHRL